MLILERKNEILKMLEEKPSVTVNQLSQIFGVSGVTVRKTLNELSREGLIRRTRGGAVNMSVAARENEQREKERINIVEKQAIARCAYELINDYDSIFLDAGSSTLELAHVIRNGNKRNLAISTNALNIAMALIEAIDIELILVGGTVRHKIMSCVGAFTERNIACLCLDKVFMGTNGITIEEGVTTPNLDEAHAKQQMMHNVKQTILLCDHSKFGKTSMARIAGIDKFSVIISDWQLEDSIVDRLRHRSVNIIIATQPQSANNQK